MARPQCDTPLVIGRMKHVHFYPLSYTSGLHTKHICSRPIGMDNHSYKCIVHMESFCSAQTNCGATTQHKIFTSRYLQGKHMHLDSPPCEKI